MLPVPEAEPVVGTWRSRHDPTAALGVPAHVTLLHPFLPRHALSAGAVGRLRRLFAGTAPIAVGLDGVCGFPGVVWLSPRDAAPLVALIGRLRSEWPDCAPYRGVHGSVVPHLTVAQSTDLALLAHAAVSVAARLPVAAHVGSASLLGETENGRWETLARFPLGGRGGNGKAGPAGARPSETID